MGPSVSLAQQSLEKTMKRPRRNHLPQFKAKVALAALCGDKTLTELAEQFDMHPNQITRWRKQGASPCYSSRLRSR